jgi:hypothetical protein
LINRTYQLLYILGTQGRKILWFVSCIAFMYVLPMSFEIFAEQQRILQKIQAQAAAQQTRRKSVKSRKSAKSRKQK